MSSNDFFAIGNELPSFPLRPVVSVVRVSIDVNNTLVMFMTISLLVIVTEGFISLNDKYLLF